MWQKQHAFKTLEQAITGLDIIEKELADVPHRDAMLFIFFDGIDKNQVKTLLDALDERMPEVKRIGASAFMDMLNGTNGIQMNLMLSDYPCFFPIQISCKPGEEETLIEKFLSQTAGIQDIKAIGIYYANPLLNASKVIKEISLNMKGVNIFGTMAKLGKIFSEMMREEEHCFSIGKDVILSGFTFIIFASRHLQTYMEYILGWKPIGKEMNIVIDRNDGNGKNCVKSIDGNPAIQIYKKYLGVEWNEEFLMNVCEFPLMVQDNGVDICMLPLARSIDGKLFFLRELHENETIRFSYATHEEVLNYAYNGSEHMKDFAAQAVVLTLCGNRVIFLGRRAKKEWEYYQKVNPELVFYHGHCEISCIDGKGGILNSALVAVGFKEDTYAQNPGKNFAVNYSSPPKAEPEGIIPLHFRISRFFSIMTEELLHFQHHLEEEVALKTRENESLSFHVVQTLADAIDAKDRYTNGHSRRVAFYSREIAKRCGYSLERQDEIYMMGLLHDVGKIGVPDSVINKPGRLTEDEFEKIKLHPSVGAHILSNIKEMPKLAIGAHWHHERFDGRGYPDGLKGEEIPEEARLIAVSDAYDAMTSNRSYRSIMPQEFVRSELEKGRGVQFDPYFASIMLEMVDDDKNYEMNEDKWKL